MGFLFNFLYLHKHFIMTYELSELDGALTEPITLAEAKAYLQIDADYASNDDVINLAISTARIRLEQYLNVGFINRDVQVQWDGKIITLPLYPNGAITSVKDTEDEDVPTDDYTVGKMKAKQIGINSKMCYGGGGNWWYSRINMTAEFTPNSFPEFQGIDTDVYTVVYNTGYDELPFGLKQSLLAEMSYIFNLHGSPITDIISPNSALLSSGYSHNLILQ